jgi:mono/diheme cytochrome c family protein
LARWVRFGIRLGLGALLGLGLAAAVLYGATQPRIDRVHRLAGAPLEAGAVSLEVGRHLVEDVTHCATCHGDDFAGRMLADDRWLGRLYTTNLTPGRGGIADWSLQEFAGLMRDGVRRDGRSALLMPSRHYRALTDDELASILVFLQSLPALDAEVPAPRVGPLARVALLLGSAPDLLSAEYARAGDASSAREPDPAIAAGDRLIALGGCRICHAEDLRGGLHALALPGEPPPSDLTPAGALGRWSEHEFVRTLRTGVTPEGRQLDPAFMPWPRIARMSDGELQSIWRYLRELPEG